jgi:uncharacterized damage-inducible protein DinB
MTPQNARIVLDLLLPHLQEEAKITRSLLAAIPPGSDDFRPHVRSRSAAEIANHLVESEQYFLGLIQTGELPSNDPAETAPPVASSVAYFEKASSEGYAGLGELNDYWLARPLTIEEWTWPAVEFLHLMITHAAHHRGQLSSYLRQMGASVPSIYGGSADQSAHA